MPHKLRPTRDLRLMIAQVAADRSGKTPNHYLPLIGEITTVQASHDKSVAGWRLASVTGDQEELIALERAAAEVQRVCPLVAAG